MKSIICASSRFGQTHTHGTFLSRWLDEPSLLSFLTLIEDEVQQTHRMIGDVCMQVEESKVSRRKKKFFSSSSLHERRIFLLDDGMYTRICKT